MKRTATRATAVGVGCTALATAFALGAIAGSNGDSDRIRPDVVAGPTVTATVTAQPIVLSAPSVTVMATVTAQATVTASPTVTKPARAQGAKLVDQVCDTSKPATQLPQLPERLDAYRGAFCEDIVDTDDPMLRKIEEQGVADRMAVASGQLLGASSMVYSLPDVAGL